MKDNIRFVNAGPLMLLLPHPSKCQTCAADHAPNIPHNAQSLYYQTKFNMDHGRGATWIDAMAHCSEDVRDRWTKELAQRGIDVAGGQVHPK